MNHYIMIRRLRWPAVLLLAGTIALLHEMGIIDSFGRFFWPLVLILWGVLLLAERAVMAAWGGYPPPPYPGQPFPGQPDYRTAANIPVYPGQAEPFIPPSHQADPEKESEEGGGL
ncbi:MAG: DUF5668 domain-containing protein [Terracidiphilus sp.]|jgi:hypothetical protein